MNNIIRISALLLVGSGYSFADTISIALAPIFTTSPGNTFLVSGILGNSSASIVDLNQISVTLNGMFVTDLSPFFLGPATVGPNSQTVNFGLFNVMVMIPYSSPFGFQTGTITILGGVEGVGGYDPTTQDVLGSVNFRVNVQNTPEPSSGAMVAVAMVAVASGARFQRRRRRAGDFRFN